MSLHLEMRCILNVDTISGGDCHPLALLTSKPKSRRFRRKNCILSSFCMQRYSTHRNHQEIKGSENKIRKMWSLPASSLSCSNQSRTSGASDSANQICWRKLEVKQPSRSVPPGTVFRAFQSQSSSKWTECVVCLSKYIYLTLAFYKFPRHLNGDTRGSFSSPVAFQLTPGTTGTSP